MEEDIEYDLDACEEYLKETYGITVYQEQVMLLSQKLADFTKGEADVKIWKDWEAFAAYAFNKSHSTCYAWIAYQTAYLKAHYPAEYMAAVLSNNMNDIKTITFFMEECKRMKLPVLGPDVNESFYKFAVNDEGAVRFGMGAVKGVGHGAVKTIVKERAEGKYKSVFDLAKRIDLRAANKKAFENLALAGGFDSFGDTHRAQYFHTENDGITFLEKAVKYGAKFQENENSAQVSLFGEASDVQIAEPQVPPAEEWGTMEKLAREKEVVGIYISGHPLDDFKAEMSYFCNGDLSYFPEMEKYVNREIAFGGVVTDVQHRVSKNGKGWALFTVEDYSESYEFRIFGEEYLKFRHFFVPNSFVYIKAFIKEGWTNRDTGKKGDPRLQFNSMQQLQDVMETAARKLTIQLDVNRLEEKTLNFINEILDTHKGDKSLHFTLYERKEKIKLQAPSKKKKVNITQELLDALTDGNVRYKIN